MINRTRLSRWPLLVATTVFVAGAACTPTTGIEPDVTPEPTPPADSGTPAEPSTPLDSGTPAEPDPPPADSGTPAEPDPPVDAGTPPPGDCGDTDPLTNSDWVGFCADRVDDNCTVDVPATPCGSSTTTHNYCNTGDEECPSTQPGSAPPVWNCTGTPPSNVIAFSQFTASNAQVASFCTYVYESTAFAGEHYIAIDVVDGADTRGPNGLCSADYSARRHMYFSDLKDANGADIPCAEVRYIHAYPQESPTGDYYPVDDQKISNRCRKAIRNVVRNPQPNFTPDIQYFAASREEALGKLAILDTAEVACVGIDRLDGTPYRPGEIWISQAAADITMTGN